MALSFEQVQEYDLPFDSRPKVMAKLRRDSRSKAFKKRHGSLYQYEVDALPPDVLRGLFQDAIDEFWTPTPMRLCWTAKRRSGTSSEAAPTRSRTGPDSR